MALFARTQDRETFDLVEEAGRNVQRASLLLRDLLVDYPERAHLVHDITVCEHEGDRVTHDVIHRLNRVRPRLSRRPSKPFDSSDGYLLATALDDIVDFAEQAADTLGVYGVEAPMEQADALAEVLVTAAAQVASAVRGLRSGADLSPYLVEIHRLENEGDRISRDGIAALFVNGIDPMVVIRWKDILAALEAAIDACEHVAHVLEGIQLKRRR